MCPMPVEHQTEELSSWSAEFGISVSKLFVFLMVSVLASENFGIEKSIGIGFGKIWYRKKYLYRFRKFLVSKKVSVSKNLVSVSKIFGIKKSIGFGKFGIEKVSDSENTFEETRNPLKNIKGWWCLFEKRDEIDDDD